MTSKNIFLLLRNLQFFSGSIEPKFRGMKFKSISDVFFKYASYMYQPLCPVTTVKTLGDVLASEFDNPVIILHVIHIFEYCTKSWTSSSVFYPSSFLKQNFDNDMETAEGIKSKCIAQSQVREDEIHVHFACYHTSLFQISRILEIETNVAKVLMWLSAMEKP